MLFLVYVPCHFWGIWAIIASEGTLLSNRRFLMRWLIMLGLSRTLCLAFFILLFNNVLAADKIEVSLAYFGADADMPALGVAQGLDEANLQGEFLGQKYALKNYDPAQLIAVSGVSAILASLDEADLRELVKLNPGVPVFNLIEGSDALREDCVSDLFHVIPSQKMRGDAVAQWLQKNADSKAIAAGWHGDFKKYAASQVNKRFKKAHDKVMDDEAYAGWMAMKIIADAVARTSSNKGEKLIAFMKKDLVMDGAKGLKMTFRSTGQLRQMMLLVEDGKIVGEAPVRGVVDTTDLETLGTLECAPCD